jgi:methylphosphotriester-DNA--protein-cysteine methyltransferase
MSATRGEPPAGKRYQLLAADGSTYESEQPGTLGGNRQARIYGRLDCGAALRALPSGYAAVRVFFADEAAAIAAGYRPCGNCMRESYRQWKEGGVAGSAEYPWLVLPAE